MDHKNAESVLPEPVGATTKALLPRATVSQAPSWAGVGAWNDAENQVRVASENLCSALTPLP